MDTNFRDVNVNRAYQLNPDAYRGLKGAVETNRTFLALQYTLEILVSLTDRIDALEEQLKSVSAAKPAVAKKATAKDTATDDGSE